MAVLCFGAVGHVLADCAADATIAETKQRYAKGQQFEAAGDL